MAGNSFPQVPHQLNLPKVLPQKADAVPKWLRILVDSLNQQQDKISTVISGMEGADIVANRPIPGIRGRTFYGTDTLTFYVDDGTNWIPIGGGSPASGMAVITVTNAASPYTTIADSSHTVMYLAAAGAGGDTDLDLYAATGSLNTLIFKKTDANAHNVSIVPFGTDTIDGVNSPVNITIQNDGFEIIDTGVGTWFIRP